MPKTSFVGSASDGMDLQDRDDGLDPQIPEKLFVLFCDETHGHSDSSDEGEAPEPDQSKLMEAMGSVVFDVLTRQERFVLVRGVLASA
jgi:hypothetical protein